jgi:hypothetical protein
MSAVAVRPTRFINAEPGILPTAGGIPVVVLSFGGEEGPIEDRAILINEAQQIVMDIIESLAIMGDPLALAIGKKFFSAKKEMEAEDLRTLESLDGEDYECGDCDEENRD